MASTNVVAGCVVRRDGTYLLIQERLPKAFGLWNIPAGHVDPGETHEQAAVREYKEEVGLDVVIERSIATYPGPEGESTKHAFTASIIGGELKPDPDEILSASWLSFAEISILNDDHQIRAPWVWDAISRVEHGFEEFPYQIIVFLDHEPSVGELIYSGNAGWYPQLALKRRFRLIHGSEDELMSRLTTLIPTIKPFEIKLGAIDRPQRMPVSVITVDLSEQLQKLHHTLTSELGIMTAAKYGDREGEGYLPHVTLEYDGREQFDPAPFIDRAIRPTSIWLVKDRPGTLDAVALKRFKLR